jgi:hypothetical protein
MIRIIVVLVGIVVAIVAGMAGALWGGPRLAGAIALGLIPVTWGVASLIERRTGRPLWHFTAPYPYA